MRAVGRMPAGPGTAGGFGPGVRRWMRAARPDGVVSASVLAFVVLFAIDVVSPDDSVGTLGVIPLLLVAWLRGSRMTLIVLCVAFLARLADAELDGVSLTTALIDMVGYALVVAAVSAARATHRMRAADRPLPAVAVAAGGLVAPSAEALAMRAASHGHRLTAREAEVAALAGLGQTAREISESLHISERTVESHLANAYPKLSVASKRELLRVVRSSETGLAAGPP